MHPSLMNFIRQSKPIFLVSSILLFQNHILAYDNISKKELTINLDKDFELKSTYENEIQKLTNKIEFLEHELQVAKQNNVTKFEEKIIRNEDPIEQNIFELTNNKEKPIIEDKSTIKGINKEGKKLYELALAALKEKKYAEAGKKFNEFIEKNPNSPLLSNAYYWYGESYVKQGNHDKAAINYLKGYKYYPNGQKAADSLLKLAYSLKELGKKEEAVKILLKLKEEFPKRSASQIKATEDALEKLGGGKN